MYNYNNEYIRYFVRKSIKRCRCVAVNQYHKSIVSDEVFNTISTELKVSGNICEILDKYFEYVNKHEKVFKKEDKSRFKDYGDIDRGEKAKYVNEKLGKIPIHNKIEKLDNNENGMDYDGTLLYPSAMWDKSSIYSKKESWFAFKPHMNDVYVEAFNNRSFN